MTDDIFPLTFSLLEDGSLVYGFCIMCFLCKLCMSSVWNRLAHSFSNEKHVWSKFASEFRCHFLGKSCISL